MPRLLVCALILAGASLVLALPPAEAAAEKAATTSTDKKNQPAGARKATKKSPSPKEEPPPPSPPPPPPEPPPILPGAPPALGAHIGEKLLFNIHWMGMPVGLAEMNLASEGAGRFTLTASLDSKGPIHLVYPVRDRLTSRGTLLPWGFKPEHYEKDQLEGPRTRHTTYAFDRDKGTVQITRDDKPLKLVEGMQAESGDPISAFHTVRFRKELTPGNSFEVQMVDGEKRYLAKITVGESKNLYTPLGWFPVIPVHPLVEASSLFRHEGSLTIWLTHDDRRLPVRVEGKVKIGEVAADLVEYHDGRGGHAKIAPGNDKQPAP